MRMEWIIKFTAKKKKKKFLSNKKGNKKIDKDDVWGININNNNKMLIILEKSSF